MSKSVSPTAIGSFVIGAVVLIVAGILIFSSGKLFTESTRLVTVFPGSVKGLQAGSPVLFRGVRIGSVKAINILYDRQELSVIVPVYLEIDNSVIQDMNLIRAGNTDDQTPPQEIEALIKAGLRANLDLQSFVTGQMSVALDFFPDSPAKLTHADNRYPEIPTTPSTMTKVISTMRNLPLQELVQKAIDTLDGIDTLVRSESIEQTLADASLAAQDARKLISGIQAQVLPLSDAAQAMLVQAQRTLQSVENEFNATLGHYTRLAKNADVHVAPALKSAAAALEAARAAFENVDELVGDNSPKRTDLDTALKEFSGAARSFRILADYLERHPDALIKGKGYSRY